MDRDDQIVSLLFSDTHLVDTDSGPCLQPCTMAASHCSAQAVCDWCLQALDLHRATAKLGYVVTALFAGLLEQGFCVPDATREGVHHNLIAVNLDADIACGRRVADFS